MKRLIIGYSCLTIISIIGILYVLLPERSSANDNLSANTTYVDESTQLITECSSAEVVEEELPTKPGDAHAEYTVYEYFNMLPDNIKNAFYNNGWTFEKVDYDLGEHFYNGECTVAGITDFTAHKVYIDDDQDSNRSILHEVGHCFEYAPNVIGVDSKQFKELYDEHWAEWYTNYGGHIKNYDTIDEAYAQCFEIYFMAPECLDEDTRTFIACEILLIS